MRTKRQLIVDPKEPPMIRDLHTALTRSPATLASDIAGGAALFVLVLAVLHLPGLL